MEGFQYTKFKRFNKFHTRASEFLLHSTHQKFEKSGALALRSPILSKLRANPQILKNLLEGGSGHQLHE